MNEPLYLSIGRILREEIRQGKYRPGERLPSSHELAVKFSVSRNTAVRVLDDLVRAGIASAVRGSGTTVSSVRETDGGRKKKRILSAGATPEFGILLADFDDMDHPYIRKILRGINARAKSSGSRLSILTADNERFPEFLDSFTGDGLLVVTELPAENVELLRRSGIPFVLIGNDFPGLDIASVMNSDGEGMEELMTLLFRRGRRRFAILGGPAGTPFCRAMNHAFRKSAKELGLNPDECVFRACGWGREEGCAAFRALRREHGGKFPFDALIAGEDFMARGAIAAAQEAGIRIPEDLSVAGFGDYPSAPGEIPLTSIDSFAGDPGGSACILLEKIVRGETPGNKQIYLASKLIVRKESL